MTSTAQAHFQEKRGYLWIALPGFIDTRNVLLLQNRIESEMLIRQSSAVAFDFTNLDMINSTTVDLIMFFRNRIMESGGLFCLVNLSQMIIMQLQSVNVDRVVTIFDTENEMTAVSADQALN